MQSGGVGAGGGGGGVVAAGAQAHADTHSKLLLLVERQDGQGFSTHILTRIDRPHKPKNANSHTTAGMHYISIVLGRRLRRRLS